MTRFEDYDPGRHIPLVLDGLPEDADASGHMSASFGVPRIGERIIAGWRKRRRKTVNIDSFIVTGVIWSDGALPPLVHCNLVDEDDA